MSWRTRRKPLTEDQKARGVIYSSELIVTNMPDIDSTLHEVFDDDPDKWRQISNLEDVSFFKGMARQFGWNVINEVRR